MFNNSRYFLNVTKLLLLININNLTYKTEISRSASRKRNIFFKLNKLEYVYLIKSYL